jgi:hypothetical protein
MKRFMVACAAVLLSFAATRTALANPELELVTGGDIIFYNGSTLTCFNGAIVSCTGAGSFNATVTTSTVAGITTVTVSASAFNGWDVSSDTGTSASPPCSSTGVCLDQNQVNIQSTSTGASPLQAYFADSGFTPAEGLTFTESATELNGTATASGYAYLPNGTLGLSGSAAPTLPAPSFPTLALTGTGLVTKDAGPVTSASPTTQPYNLATEFNFTVGAVGGGYSVTETIAAVPEPASVVLFGGALLVIATTVRRKVANRA